MKHIHLILTGLSLSIILLSINRLTSFTSGVFLQPYEYLRLADFLAMIPISLFSVILYYLLKREIVYDHQFKQTGLYKMLGVALIAGIYFFAAGSGDHEVTNYLNTRFCLAGTVHTPICDIVAYNDDEFSHFIYYLGFILLNVSLMLLAYTFPQKVVARKKDLFFIGGNSLFIALGIFANLAFEPTGLDLLFFGSVAAFVLYLLYKRNWQIKQYPVLFYFAVSYVLGVGSTLLVKLF